MLNLTKINWTFVASLLMVFVLAYSLSAQVVIAANVGTFYEGTATLNTANHGDTIQEVAEAIRDLNYEVEAYFDQAGHKLFEITDFDANSVCTNSTIISYLEKVNFANVICIHNHPQGATFSLADLRKASYLGVKCNIVVSSQRTYFISAGKSGWPNYEEIEAFTLSLLQNETAYQIIDTYHDQSGQVASITWVLTESGMRTIANQYGLNYSWVWYNADCNPFTTHLPWMQFTN